MNVSDLAVVASHALNSASGSVLHEQDETGTSHAGHSDSPSGEFGNGFANDFDINDHRLQPSSLPRTNSDNVRSTRRGTLASICSERPHLLAPDNAPVTRDFEQAITDDDRSTVISPIEGVRRKNTFKRHRQNSRDSSRSSSTSTPNSVRAFAEHSRRRDRAGTAHSKPGSIDLQLHRTSSRETHRRRPTFSESVRQASIIVGENDPDAAENDVCYPQSDEESNGSSDDDELQEFISRTEPDKKNLFAKAANIPKIRTEGATPEKQPTDLIVSSDEDFPDLEKGVPPVLEPEGVCNSRRPSQPEVNKRLWTFFSTDNPDAAYSTTIGGLLVDGETVKSVKQLFSLRTNEGCWWLDGVNATEDEVKVLCSQFKVHPLTREDIIKQEPREKMEYFSNYYFVSFRGFDQDSTSEEYLEPLNVYAVVWDNAILSFSFKKNPHTSNVLQRIRRMRDHIHLNADWIAYAFIDDIVDSFNPFVQDIELEVDVIEDQVFTARPEDARQVLQRIGNCRKKVISLLRLLGSKSDVIKGFAKRRNEDHGVTCRSDVTLYLSDILDHVLTMRENLTHSEQLLSRSHNNFLAQVNVEHISSGNKTNKVLSRVTLLASILVPLNLVTGLFGMNVSGSFLSVRLDRTKLLADMYR